MIKEPFVSIVVLNWNGLEDTKLCIESIKNLCYKNYELILVDNGSTDGSKQVLPEILDDLDFPHCFVDLPRNTGFTGGHIAGFEHSKGTFLLLLNNDVLIAPDAVDQALAVFKEELNVGVVGGRSYFWNHDNPPLNTGNAYYSYQLVFPDTAEVETLREGEQRQEVNNVSGACVFIRRDVIEKVGYLDPQFFAYYEETDLFARMKRAGYKIIYEPSVAIWHKVGASTKDKQIFYYSLIFRNQFVFAMKNFDRAFLGRFIRQYTKAFIRSCMGMITKPSNRPLHIGRVKAFAWNVLHILPTLRSRQELFKTLKGGYNDMILKEQGGPFSIVIRCDRANLSVKKVHQTLNSILSQTVPPRDVLLLANHQTANLITPIAEKLQARIVIDSALINTAPENIAITCATRPWMMFLEPGTMLKTDFVREMLLTSYKNRLAKILYCESNVYKGANSLHKFNTGNWLGTSFLFNKAFTADSGGFRSDLSEYNRMFELVLRILKSGNHSVGYCKKVLIHEPAEVKVETTELLKVKQLHPVLFNPFLQTLGLEPIRLASKAKRLALRNVRRFISVARMLFRRPQTTEDRALKRRYAKSFFHHLLHLNLRSIRSSMDSVIDRQHKITRAVTDSSSIGTVSPDDIIVFINCRDRVDPLRHLIFWLKKFGLSKIVLIDNDSSYKPLLKYYQTLPYQILYLGRNAGHKGPWETYAIPLLAKDHYFILSDPDILPVEGCPEDTIKYFLDVLKQHPKYNKVGFGLKIDDLPDHYKLKQTVIRWEAQFWKKRIAKGLYEADIDTTFALYRPNMPYFLENSIRTDFPYVARHEPWYQDSDHPSEEDRYYRTHASRSVNTWNMDDIPIHFKKAIAKSLSKITLASPQN